jgi:hypothetical protein
VAPLIVGHDDFAVKSATLLVDGNPVSTVGKAPYLFTWTPTAADAGKTISFKGIVTDSSGQETTTEELTVKVAKASPIKPTLTAGTLTKNKTTGVATLSVNVNTAGTLTMVGSKVVSFTKTTAGAGVVKIPIKAKGVPATNLTKHGLIYVTVTITFKSEGGTVTKTTKIALVKTVKKKKKH